MNRLQPRAALGLALALVLCSVPLAGAQDNTPEPASVDSAQIRQAEELVSHIEVELDSLRALASLVRGQGEAREAGLRWQGRQLIQSIHEKQNKLVDLVLKLRATGEPLDDVVGRFSELLAIQDRMYRQVEARWSRDIDRLRDQRGSTPAPDLADLETKISEARTILDDLFSYDLRVLTIMDSIGTASDEVWRTFDRALQERAETLVGRLQLAVQERDQLKSRLGALFGASGDDAHPDRVLLEQAKRRVAGVAKSLERTADMMRRRGMETTQYRQFIVKATGEISTNILDPKVLSGLIQDFVREVWDWLQEKVPGFLIKLGIVFLFILVFQLGFRITWWLFRLTGLSKLSRLMQDLVGRLVRPFASLLGLFFGLMFIGIDATTLLAGAGVLGVIVGLALQDSLSNIAAGIFILFTRPFDVDDIVRAGGVIGKVRMLGLANTTIVTFDGRRLMIPNRKIWGEVIENRSIEASRRVEVELTIPYGADVDRVLDILRDAVRQDPRVLEEPAPQVFVKELAESGADIAVWPWVKTEDWWSVLTALPRAIRVRLREEGIDVAYPRRDLRITEGSAGPMAGEPADDR